MNILLDTQIAIWALLDSPKLTEKARELILDHDNTLYYSVVSVWEVMLKHGAHPESIVITGKEFADYCQEAGFVSLHLYDKHVVRAEEFITEPDGHKDPFDRILLAQAKSENLMLLTNDSKLPLYNEKCVIVQ